MDQSQEGSTEPTTMNISAEESNVQVAAALAEADDIENGSLPVIELPPTPNEKSSAGPSSALTKAEIVDLEAAARGGDDDCQYYPESYGKELVAQAIEEVPSDSDSETQSTHSAAAPLRAEFLSATVLKESQDTPMGLEFISKNEEVLISAIAPGTLAASTPFRVGDRLLSVNTKRCYIMEAEEVYQFIAGLVGAVTFVVHNEGGDPNLVESMATRPPNRKCGLVMKSSGQQHLRISRIDKSGLFFESLINVGDPIVSINGEDCTGCNAQAAGEMVDRAGEYITVKARTLFETGRVVAAFSCTNSTGSTIPPELVQALSTNRQQVASRTQILAMVMIVVLLIGMLLGMGFFA